MRSEAENLIAAWRNLPQRVACGSAFLRTLRTMCPVWAALDTGSLSTLMAVGLRWRAVEAGSAASRGVWDMVVSEGKSNLLGQRIRVVGDVALGAAWRRSVQSLSGAHNGRRALTCRNGMGRICSDRKTRGFQLDFRCGVFTLWSSHVA